MAIGSKGDFPSAAIEDEKGIAFKRAGNSLIFTHEKTEMEIPITEDVRIGDYPWGKKKIPHRLYINIHTPDWRTEAVIEYDAAKAEKYYYKKLRKRLNKEMNK